MEISEIIQNLKEKDPHARYTALKSLDQTLLSDPAVLKLVIRICRRDKLPYNRLEAMNSLRQVWSTPEIVEAYRERLEDDQYIAEACIQLLGSISDQAACSLLQETYQGTKQMRLKLQIIQAYASASQDAVFRFLKETKAHESSNDRIRASIIVILGEQKNPTLRQVFMKALQDANPRVRANAVEAISSICSGKDLFQILAHCAKDKNNRVRANALRSLILLGVRQAEPLVHEMAHHQNPNFRRSAAWVLGEVGACIPQSQQWLEELSHDSNQNVLYRAGQAHKKLGEALALRQAA
jgi:HEAT repeat protein